MALRERTSEVDELEMEVGQFAHGTAAELRSQVKESARELRDELRAQASQLRSRETGAPFGGELRKELERFTAEWTRLKAPGTTRAQAKSALGAAIDAAVEQLRKELSDPQA